MLLASEDIKQKQNRTTKKWRLDRGYYPKKTGETVDRRRQNNGGSVKAAVSSRRPYQATRQCTAQLLFQLPCVGRVKRTDNVRCTAAEEELVEAKEVQLAAAQLLRATHDKLCRANLKVQLHLPPLDLLIFCRSCLEPCSRIAGLSLSLICQPKEEGWRTPQKHHASRGEQVRDLTRKSVPAGKYENL